MEVINSNSQTNGQSHHPLEIVNAEIYLLYLQLDNIDKFETKQNKPFLKQDFKGNLKIGGKVMNNTIVVESIEIIHGFDVNELEILEATWRGLLIDPIALQSCLFVSDDEINKSLLDGTRYASIEIEKVTDNKPYRIKFTKERNKNWEITR